MTSIQVTHSFHERRIGPPKVIHELGDFRAVDQRTHDVRVIVQDALVGSVLDRPGLAAKLNDEDDQGDREHDRLPERRNRHQVDAVHATHLRSSGREAQALRASIVRWKISSMRPLA